MNAPDLSTGLLRLIRRYTSASGDAAQKLRDELAVTDLLGALHGGTLHRAGKLPDGTQYRFHGVGCAVERAGISVDFDFGPEGRTDGFDAWRLHLFAEQFPDETHFHDEAVVAAALAELQRAGMVAKPGWTPSPHLYYLAEQSTARDPESRGREPSSPNESGEQCDDPVAEDDAAVSGVERRVPSVSGDLDGGDGLDDLAACDGEDASLVGARDSAGALGAVEASALGGAERLIP